MKEDIVLEERLRAAADHLERMVRGTEPEVAMEELGPELVELLRDAADACRRASEFRESWERAAKTFKVRRHGESPGSVP